MTPNTWPVVGAKANQAWLRLIGQIYRNGNSARPRGLEIKEILCNTTVTDMRFPIVSIRRRKLGYKFLAAEAWWILCGRNDVASIKSYSRHIASFSDDGHYFSGAYGVRVVDQLRYVVDTLVKDIDSRQAVLTIWRQNPRDSKDIPCTISVQWLIRNARLYCIDTMRSSDAGLGFPYDCFNFSMLSAYILLLLRERSGFFKEIELGALYLTAGSSHLYVNARNDGAPNVPYVIEDVEEVLQHQDEIDYAPLCIDDFENADQLLEHLELCKDKHGKMDFMQEFQK